MIVRKTPDWRIVAGYTGRDVAIFTGVASLVAIGHAVMRHFEVPIFSLSAVPLSVIGAALTIFLGFRTNSAYDRWWEARTLWGGIVNHSRTWARQTLTYPDARAAGDADEVRAWQREMVHLQIAWVNATRLSLRKQPVMPEIKPWIPADERDRLAGQLNAPSGILLLMAERLQLARTCGWTDTFRFTSQSETLTELTNLLGGCERIKNTTLPRQYDYFPRLFVYAFCTLVPFALVESLHWYVIPVTALVAFIFFALDNIGANIENPFENTIHDTPMSALCTTIEINLRQMLGDKDVPEAPKPVNGFLY